MAASAVKFESKLGLSRVRKKCECGDEVIAFMASELKRSSSITFLIALWSYVSLYPLIYYKAFSVEFKSAWRSYNSFENNSSV